MFSQKSNLWQYRHFSKKSSKPDHCGKLHESMLSGKLSPVYLIFYLTILFSVPAANNASSPDDNYQIRQALDRAVVEDKPETILQIVQTYPNWTSPTAFSLALAFKRKQAFKVLVEHVTDDIDNLKLLQILENLMMYLGEKEIGADEMRAFLKISGHWKNKSSPEMSPLMIAVRQDHIDLIQELLKIPSIKKNINYSDGHSISAIHLAHSSSAVGLLIQHGANIALKTSDGRSCLHFVAEAMLPSLKHIERQRRETWPSDAEYMIHMEKLRRLSQLMRAYTAMGLDIFEASVIGSRPIDQLPADFFWPLELTFKLRKATELEMKALAYEFSMSPHQSFIAWLPHEPFFKILSAYLLETISSIVASIFTDKD